MRLYLKFADLVLLLAKGLTILIIGAMVISVLVGVFFRFVIPIPMAWPPEAARFLMVALAMIGSSIAVRQLDHVGITFIVDALPKPLAFVLYIAGNLLVAVFLAVFVWFSARMTLEMGPRQISSSLNLSMAYAYAAMPIGGAMMLIQLVASMLEGIARHRAAQSPFFSTPAQTSV